MPNLVPVPPVPLRDDPTQDAVWKRWLTQLVTYNNTLPGGPYVVGDIFYASSTTTIASLADVAAGNVLTSGGVSTAPAWGKVTILHISPDILAFAAAYG